MRSFRVSGMSCSACVARVERAVLRVEGVKKCAVSLLTGTMTVEGDFNDDAVISAVKGAGYDAFSEAKGQEKKDSELKDTETPKMKKRLFSSLVLLILLMYLSMGHTMLKLPLPSVLAESPLSFVLTQMILSALILIINQKFFINGFKGVLKGAPNMDTLVALGSLASFVYSTAVLFDMCQKSTQISQNQLWEMAHGLYFESSAMILVLITVGKLLEAYSKGKTTNALKSLIDMSPKSAIVIRDGKEIEIPCEDVRVNDVFVVKNGAMVPADGEIIEGHASIDESSLTGESMPVDKHTGERVFASTVLSSGYIKCKALKVGEETTHSQVIKTVKESIATKAPIAKIADRVAGIFVPTVMAIALITFVIWLALGAELGYSLSRAIAVLVISCPCSLGLATPVAIMVANGVGAKKGILFKNAEALEETGKVKIVALDKTGTITRGEPVVTDILPLHDISKARLLELAYALEAKSEHPLARAIVKKAEELKLEKKEVESFEVMVGGGVKATEGEDTLVCGSYRLVSQLCELDSDTVSQYNRLANEGKTPVFFLKNDTPLGIIAIRDAIKEDSRSAISALKEMGIHTVMITGDNEKSAKAVQAEVLVDEVIADVMPLDKEGAIEELKRRGAVAMIGDGVNDAPALAKANIGIAIGNGTDVAIDTASIVLTKGTLTEGVTAIKLSRKTLRVIKQNLFWAFIYNIIGIPIATGFLTSSLGWELSPMLAAGMMSLSSICVVLNALRLNMFDKNSSSNKNKTKGKKEKNMKITVGIKGMMCPHCEARVKKCLEELEGVITATPSHVEANAVIEINETASVEKIKETIVQQGYEVTYTK